MNCWTCFWVVLIAGAVTVSGINVDILHTILSWPTSCKPPQRLNDSHLEEVECGGLAALQDVRSLLKREKWPFLGSLIITNSYFTTSLTLDDLVNYTALHTLTFKKSHLKEWKKSSLPTVPRLRTLVVEQCWDNDTFLAKPTQLTLRLSSKLQEAVPELEELYLYNNFMPHIAEPSALKNLNKFVINEGAAICGRENLWLLEWHDAGKVEVKSTVCFVGDRTREGLESMNIMFTFVNLEILHVLRFVKSTFEDCPAPCNCEVVGFRDKTPISYVNCSSANMTQLPDLIPSHTNRVILSNNHITNISKIFINPKYRSVNDVLMDNNLVDHIDGDLLYDYLKYRSLDFSIDLANNKLETLPVQHLEKMYEENTNKGHIVLPTFNLGGNPWNCDDCAFLVPFQNLIFYQVMQKERLKEIRCGEGRYAEGQQIIMLPVRSHCKVEPPLEPLDILNICLGILLLLFIINFLHNLVQYQRHGKLPWIVTKLPCC